MRISVVIPTFRGAWRLAHLLESVSRFDPLAFKFANWLVVEDPSDNDSTWAYQRVVEKYPDITFTKLPNWSNMHGAAMRAFELAFAAHNAEWVVYLGDDLLVTPFAVTNVLQFLEVNNPQEPALIGIPYWNAHDLTPGGYDGNGGGDPRPDGVRNILESKMSMYARDQDDWLPAVPHNPHWDGDGFARPYINVNGAGFACHSAHYRAVGGFAEGTWCLDESISVRTWLRSDRSVVCLPGPPFIHYFGGATESNPPAHDLHTAERWEVAMGMNKETAGRLCQEKLDERRQRVEEEMKNAIYFRD